MDCFKSFMFDLQKYTTLLLWSDDIALLTAIKVPSRIHDREAKQFRSNWGTKQQLVRDARTSYQTITTRMRNYLSQIRDIWPHIAEMARNYITYEFWEVPTSGAPPILPKSSSLIDTPPSIKSNSSKLLEKEESSQVAPHKNVFLLKIMYSCAILCQK